MKNIVHFLMIPWTGLGLFQGYRGDFWMRNRIKIFKQFVLPSLVNQTSKDFILWCAWRYEEKHNPIVSEFKKELEKSGLKIVHTHSGCPFHDDKYLYDIARERFVSTIHGAMGDLINIIGEADSVIVQLQPSDDCYKSDSVSVIKRTFLENPDAQVVSYKKGYVMDYINRRLAEWNPKTNPPFYAIKFPKEIFTDPFKHVEYAKHVSHEYVGDNLKLLPLYDRGFLVGTHSDNISTVFDHLYTGNYFKGETLDTILDEFALKDAGKLVIPFSIRGVIFRNIPYFAKRKLRYWAESKWILRPVFSFVYNILRS